MLCAPRNDIDLCIFTWLAGINGVGLGLLILSLALPPNRRIGIFFYPWLVTPLEIFFFYFEFKIRVERPTFLCHSPLPRPVVLFTSEPVPLLHFSSLT